MQLRAQPFPCKFEVAHTALVVIDMQRELIEPGGFGEALGNDVALLAAIVPACQAALCAWRRARGLVVHTREAHAPDLSDCPPAKRLRGNPRLRIGDVGPMGRMLVAGACPVLDGCTENHFPALKVQAQALDMIRAQGAIVRRPVRSSSLFAALAAH